MALPAGRYGVTKNQLLKIKKLPMNTIKLIEELTEKFNLLGTAAFKNSTSVVTESSDLVESGAVYTALQGKADNSVIGTVEDANASTHTYSAGQGFICDGQFRVAKGSGIAVGEQITDSNSFVDMVGNNGSLVMLASELNLKAVDDSVPLTDLYLYKYILVVTGKNNSNDGFWYNIVPISLVTTYMFIPVMYSGALYNVTAKYINNVFTVTGSTIPTSSSAYGIRAIYGIK